MVLLVGINAKYIHTTLAVRSLQANAGKYRKDVEIAEYTINHRREEIFQDIYRRKPEAVGFSCYLWNIEYVMGLAGDLKKVLPKVKRMLPWTGSMPIQAKTRPTQPIIKPLSTLLAVKEAMMVRPKRAIMNLSWGPNWKAKRANGGAKNSRATTLRIPPQKEDIADSTRAS